MTDLPLDRLRVDTVESSTGDTAAIVIGLEDKRDTRRFARARAVLALLAKKGPLNKYVILKRLPMKFGSKPIILETITRLKSQGLILVHHVDQHARGSEGRSEYYDLSLNGLTALTNFLYGKDNNLLRQLPTKYRSLLPEVFDLWPAFVETGVEDSALYGLWMVCTKLGRGLQREKVWQTLLIGTMPKEKGGQEQWIDAITKNAMLRERLIKALQIDLERLRSQSVEVAKRIRQRTETIAWLQGKT